MGLVERSTDLHNKKDKSDQTGTILVHAFSDLTYISPVVFLYLLKECYIHGTCKATMKFRALQQQVYQVLHNNPQPGPATFVIRCLYILPIFTLYCEGFSHLIVSALRRYLKLGLNPTDALEAKDIAAQLFLDIVGGFVNHDERIVVKIVEVFDIKLDNVEKAMCQLKERTDSGCDAAKTFVEHYVFELIESQSFMTAVSLLEQFSIRQSGKSFLFSMIQNKEFKAADKWAIFMGKQMLCVLVQEYIDRNLLKHAYDIIKKNNLQQEFPDVYHKCKESSLKKLAEKGCWDVAEAKTNDDRQLLEYLVYLAMEAGYSEKVDELCDRYSLKGFLDVKVPEASHLHSRYLHLNELVVEDIIWVDNVDGLQNATCHIEGCKVVGVDCEWKPNYEKGSKPNKVSIMQIASEKMVFIFDLIKLFKDVPDILDNCLARILQSPRILKLGYNFQCDTKQLAHSYGELECFKQYEMLLDVQNVFKEPQGGLSGLAKKILGAGLNKTRRNSNWEQRPLTQNQLEYAALDAAVLVHIFLNVQSHSHPATVSEGHEKIEWKSHIVSRMDNVKKSKKGVRSKKQSRESPTDQHCQSS
ncbi:exonuclease mut-7 homolog isoform X2 [Juglans microcarpa x Juglans regia]|nr:exonuclease mut-7 homolog isoform X2 [Juglans microcarpa x Juglans regia]XP_041020299.1 exonuclease mut-7 homolog isoform X2 [Juglans microcarpa x Juglans regia]